jgi:hypothetical protein
MARKGQIKQSVTRDTEDVILSGENILTCFLLCAKMKAENLIILENSMSLKRFIPTKRFFFVLLDREEIQNVL